MTADWRIDENLFTSWSQERGCNRRINIACEPFANPCSETSLHIAIRMAFLINWSTCHSLEGISLICLFHRIGRSANNAFVGLCLYGKPVGPFMQNKFQ